MLRYDIFFVKFVITEIEFLFFRFQTQNSLSADVLVEICID